MTSYIIDLIIKRINLVMEKEGCLVVPPSALHRVAATAAVTEVFSCVQC